MQIKINGTFLNKVLKFLEKEHVEIFNQVGEDDELFITRIPASSQYNPEIPTQMIDYFRGGYLTKALVEGVQDHLPSIEKFCIIYKINFNLIEDWAEEYSEMKYAMEVATIVMEELLVNESLTSRNSAGARYVMESRIGGKWKAEKEKGTGTINVILGPLGNVQPSLPSANAPEVVVSTTILESPDVAVVDPKTIDRVVTLDKEVRLLPEEVSGAHQNMNMVKEKSMNKILKTRDKAKKKRAEKDIVRDLEDLLGD